MLLNTTNFYTGGGEGGSGASPPIPAIPPPPSNLPVFPPTVGLMTFLAIGDNVSIFYKYNAGTHEQYYHNFFLVDPFLAGGFLDLPHTPLVVSEVTVQTAGGVVLEYGVHYTIVLDGANNQRRFLWNPAYVIAGLTQTEFTEIAFTGLGVVGGLSYFDLPFIPAYPLQTYLQFPNGTIAVPGADFTVVEDGAGNQRRITWNPLYAGTPTPNGLPTVGLMVLANVGDTLIAFYEKSVLTVTQSVEIETFLVDPFLVSGSVPLTYAVSSASNILLLHVGAVAMKMGVNYSVVNDISAQLKQVTWNPAVDPSLSGLMSYFSAGDKIIAIYKRTI